jgi:large repetitive protein
MRDAWLKLPEIQMATRDAHSLRLAAGTWKMHFKLLFLGGLVLGVLAAIDDGAILRYDFSTVSGAAMVSDTSGNGRSGTLHGSPAAQSRALTLDGLNDYVELPPNILRGVVNMTVELEVLIDASQQTPYFIFGIGNTASNSGLGYVFVTGDAFRGSITTGDWTAEQTVSSGRNLARGQWMHLAYTLGGGAATLYVDGIEVARKVGVTIEPGDIGEGATSANYIGRSVYTSDKLLKGQIRRFALWERALDASEVLSLSGNVAAISGVTLEDPALLKLDPIVNLDTRNVIFPVKPGTDLTHLSPVFSTVSGITSTPASGTTVDLSSPVTYKLAQGSAPTAQWTMRALHMGSPALPGYYADPNIAIFNKTYYIYATTDGLPGWSGNTFHAWSSLDLVTWKRPAAPILTLDGANGNVPWATGNAWAPTVIERGGRFYFFFSGHNPTYNRKTIGVAVASSPDGPFVAQPRAMILNNEAVVSGQAIDPCAFRDPKTGRFYLFWGNGSPVFAELADDMMAIKMSTLKTISDLRDFREGSFVNYRDGIYHLTYSIDDTGSENYRVGYATASSVNGPWAYRGVVLEKDRSLGILGTGHNSIVQVPETDEWYIAYHRFGMPGGDGTHRETTVDKLDFDRSGLIKKVVPTLGGVGPRLIL